MKSAFLSKINWVGFLLTLLGLLIDPTFQGHLSQMLPPEVFSKVVAFSGLLVMILRTFFTSTAVQIPGVKPK